MERWGVRECVCPLELFIRTGSITETQRGFRRERNQQEAPSPNAIRRWIRQWREEGSRVKSHLVGHPQFAHLTTLPECWRLSAAVRGDLHVSGYVATLHRVDQRISVPESSTKQWYLVVSTRSCYGPHGCD